MTRLPHLFVSIDAAWVNSFAKLGDGYWQVYATAGPSPFQCASASQRVGRCGGCCRAIDRCCFVLGAKWSVPLSFPPQLFRTNRQERAVASVATLRRYRVLEERNMLSVQQ